VIADYGEAASWRYVEFFTANIRNPNAPARLRPRLRGFLLLVRRARPDLGNRPAARRRRPCRGAAADVRRVFRQAIARRSAHAVRLAGGGPGAAAQSRRRRARPKARGEEASRS